MIDDGNGGANYNVIYVPDATGVINRAALTVTANADARFVTRTDPAGFNGVQYAGLVNGEQYTVLGGTLNITRTNAATDVAAGIYNNVLVPSGLTSSNYDITFINGDYTIVPANQLLIRTIPQTVVYGNSPVFSTTATYLDGVNDTIHTLTRVGNTFIDSVGGQVTVVLNPYVQTTNNQAPVSSTGHTVVGTYDVKDAAPVVVGSNFVGPPVFVGTLRVNPRAVTPNAGNVTRTYDGTNSMNNVVLGMTGRLVGDDLSISGIGSFTQRNVGTGLGYNVNNIVLNGTDAGNYFLAGGLRSLSGNDGEITQATLTVTAQTDTRVYDGTNSSSVAPVRTGTIFAGDNVITEATQRFDNKNAGTGKTITASGLVINDGNNGNNYNVFYVNDTTGVITRAPLTVTAQALTRMYNGTNSSSLAPVRTGTIFAGDSVTIEATQRFDTKHVGIGKTITASGLVINDGNSGSNYDVTYVPSTAGEITPAILNVTAVSHARIFNGNTSSSVSPLVTGLFVGDSVTTQAIQTFDTPDVGTGKTLTATGLVIDDGNGGNNYTVNYVSVSTGVINPVPVLPPTPTSTSTPTPSLGQVLAPNVVPAVPKSVVVTTLVCESGNGIDLQHRDDVKSPRNAPELAERSAGQSAGCKPWPALPQVAQPATPEAAPSLALPAVSTSMVDVLTAVHNLKIPTVLFDFDSAVISAKGKNYLDLLSKILRTATGNIDRIEIKGHTDSIGPLAVNQVLSENRANAVKNYLIRLGIKNAILTKGMADKEPLQICADRDGACRQNQRRVEIKVFFTTGKPENFSQLQSK